MGAITYKEVDPGRIGVWLVGKRVGTIAPSEKGFRYYPKGQLTGGDWFATVEEVQKSLEES